MAVIGIFLFVIAGITVFAIPIVAVYIANKIFDKIRYKMKGTKPMTEKEWLKFMNGEKSKICALFNYIAIVALCIKDLTMANLYNEEIQKSMLR